MSFWHDRLQEYREQTGHGLNKNGPDGERHCRDWPLPPTPTNTQSTLCYFFTLVLRTLSSFHTECPKSLHFSRVSSDWFQVSVVPRVVPLRSFSPRHPNTEIISGTRNRKSKRTPPTLNRLNFFWPFISLLTKRIETVTDNPK